MANAKRFLTPLANGGRAASDAELLTCHTQAQLDAVRGGAPFDAYRGIGGVYIDSNKALADCYWCADTELAARLAVACVVDLVRSDAHRLSFAAVRPPGHHAEHNSIGGFCFFNAVACAARAFQQHCSSNSSEHKAKVIILDFDVHHGNGTQQIFDDDASVLYFSVHRYEKRKFFPFSGHYKECGTGAAKGFSVNVPLAKGYGDAELCGIIDAVFLPIARAFAPRLVLVSAGFDACAHDLVGGCNVTPSGYAYVLHRLKTELVDAAAKSSPELCAPRLCVALEGGYNLLNLRACALACVDILTQRRTSDEWLAHFAAAIDVRAMRDEQKDKINEAILYLSKFWKNLNTL